MYNNPTISKYGKKCCVYGCNANYLSTLNKNENASKTVYRFPTDKDERQRWIDVVGKINANLKVTSEAVVCELHWSHGDETVRKKEKNGQSILRPSSKEYIRVFYQILLQKRERHNELRTMREIRLRMSSQNLINMVT